MKKKSQLFKDDKNKNEIEVITRKFIEENFIYDSLRKEYCIDESLYRRIYQLGSIDILKNKLASHYYDSKQYYLVNINRYKGALTVIRQLSRYLDIPYRYKIVYYHAKYNINYYFDLESNLDKELSISNTS
jgi:hypothetical protein